MTSNFHVKKPVLLKILLLLWFIPGILITANSQNPDIKNRYNEKINQAEKLLFEKKYPEAKRAFEEALKLMPDEIHPRERIKEINAILGIKEDNRQEFLSAVKNADQFYSAGRYEDALKAYMKANDLQPGDEHVTRRILEINRILREQQARTQAYQTALQRGLQFFQAGELEKARQEFETALSLNNASVEAKNHLAQINRLIHEKEQYEKAIAEADELYIAQNFTEARIAYLQALTIRPDDTYARNMIGRIDEIIIQQQNDARAIENAYQEAISAGDKAFQATNYLAARELYQAALNLKPTESYPRARITEINNILADQDRKQKLFDQYVAAADQHFARNEYQPALTNYESALAIFPEHSFVVEKITQIQALIKEQNDQLYTATIQAADRLFEQKKLPEALNEYQNAARIKPDENYPKGKINEIQSLLQNLAEKDNNYREKIALADQLFTNQNYSRAMAEYQNALDLKPEEPYPAEKIAEIRLILANLAERDANYRNLIASADQFYQKKQYEQALGEYLKAAGLKPEEPYPAEKISEIRAILTQMAETESAYQQALQRADELFNQKNYSGALREYELASRIQPNSSYPAERILEINKILNSLAETEAAYQQHISRADQFLLEKNYNQALQEYRNALQIKPAESYPDEKISEINQILSAIAENDKAYHEAISKGEEYLNNNELDLSRLEYEKALKLKPGEVYPREKLLEIDQRIRENQDKTARFNQLISTGDFHLNAGNLSEARQAYSSALEIFPDQPYPKEQLGLIEATLKAERERIKKEYDAAIAEAERHFRQKAYDQALIHFQNAAAILPEEEYPGKKIEEITRLIESFVMVELVPQSLIIQENQLVRYEFKPLPPQGRKESYIFLRARNISEKEIKIFLNYGRNNSNNGGFVINLPTSQQNLDFLIKVGNQYRWLTEDNNWISVLSEGGNAEIQVIKISQE